MKFYAENINGKFKIKEKEAFDEQIKKLDGKQIVLDIKEVSKIRTNQQNKYYHGVVVKIIADWTGDTCKSTHDYLKAKYLCDKTGKLPKFRSTTDLTTVEMNQFWEKIALDMAFHGVAIPPPDSPDLDNLLETMSKKFIP